MIQKFKKKPVVIEAIQWDGKNLRAIIQFTGLNQSLSKRIDLEAANMWEQYEALVEKEGLKIFTLEGAMMASVGDYIIKGVKGEVYPCKPEIFEMTYEPATTPSPDVAGSDAVAFAEWIAKEGWHTATNVDQEEEWRNLYSDQGSPTIQELYAKFNPNPQPAGASVEQAAVDYANKAMPYVWPLNKEGEPIRKTGPNPPNIRKHSIKQRPLIKAFLAGAAFQAAQGANRITVIREEKEEVKIDSPNVTQPAPAAVSAGTIPAYLRNALDNWEISWQEFNTGYRNVDGQTTRVGIAALSQATNQADTSLRKAWHQAKHESAPGDVRELVEALEKISNEFCGLIETDSVKKLKQIAQTALAGIKGK